MKSDRPYRKGLSIDVILGEMRRVAGTQLDPELVALFIENAVYEHEEEAQALVARL